jgi:hypothetical protein
LSRQFCIAFRIAPRKPPMRITAAPRSHRVSVSAVPSDSVSIIQTFSASSFERARSGGNCLRLRPNVGQRGSGWSKRWIGKLLEIPPSENQQRSAMSCVSFFFASRFAMSV